MKTLILFECVALISLLLCMLVLFMSQSYETFQTKLHVIKRDFKCYNYVSDYAHTYRTKY